MTAIEHPADGTMSPPVSNKLHLELCNGTLVVESYEKSHGQQRVRITDRLGDASISLRWEQWEDLKEAIKNLGLSVAEPSDEDRIRDAMAEAQDHPGRIITR